MLKDVMEKEDANGRVPFSICYVCKNGRLIDIQEKCVVCIGVDTHYHTHTIKALPSGEIRIIRDHLILRVNNSKIIVN